LIDRAIFERRRGVKQSEIDAVARALPAFEPKFKPRRTRCIVNQIDYTPYQIDYAGYARHRCGLDSLRKMPRQFRRLVEHEKAPFVALFMLIGRIAS
jgi:hypothetical protein